MSIVANDQTLAFLQSEADDWFLRNRESLLKKKKENDYIYVELTKLYGQHSSRSLDNVSILEVGCSNGYRLHWLKSHNAQVVGFDPSLQAVADGKALYKLSEDEIFQSDALSFFQSAYRQYDIILFAHSLYLISPVDIPQIVASAVNLLREGGYIVIYDFDSQPHRQKYHHREGIYSYKAKYDTYFTWLPHMHLVKKAIIEHNGGCSVGDQKEDCALSIIRKIPLENVFPELLSSEY